MEKLNIKTNNRIDLIDITDKVRAVASKSKVKHGICFIFCPHTTAGLTINENADPQVNSVTNTKAISRQGNGLAFHIAKAITGEGKISNGVKRDIINTLNKLVPENAGYTHSEGNADSHIKSSLFGSSLTIFIEDGQLALGSWQGIYFCESDGPRSREAWVKIL